VGDRTGREKIPDCVIGFLEQAVDIINAGARRRMVHATGYDEIGIPVAKTCCVDPREMVSRPDVVMSDIGDPIAARDTNSFVIGKTLASHVMRQIVPGNSRVRKRPYDGFSLIIAAVTDNNQFEIFE
jgi:hypothetical protein